MASRIRSPHRKRDLLWFCPLVVMLSPLVGGWWLMMMMSTNRHAPGRKTGVSPYRPKVQRKRRRALSISPVARSTTFYQQQSPLFALPAELRQQIFSYVLCGHTLPLEMRHDGRLAISEPFQYSKTASTYDTVCSAPKRDRVTSLFSTCHLGYLETMPMLYSTCHLTTDDPAVLLYLAKVFPPSHLQGMHITLTWRVYDAPDYKSRTKPFRKKNALWLEVWTVMAKLKGLASLQVYLTTDYNRAFSWVEKGEEALRKIEPAGPWEVGTLDVYINWPTAYQSYPPYIDYVDREHLPTLYLHKETERYKRPAAFAAPFASSMPLGHQPFC